MGKTVNREILSDAVHRAVGLTGHESKTPAPLIFLYPFAQKSMRRSMAYFLLAPSSDGVGLAVLASHARESYRRTCPPTAEVQRRDREPADVTGRLRLPPILGSHLCLSSGRFRAVSLRAGCGCHRMKEVMMIVPVNRHVNETQDISKKSGDHSPEDLPVCAMRYAKLQHHYCDDNSDYAVAKCGETIFAHRSIQLW
jgi:hypothetical protein